MNLLVLTNNPSRPSFRQRIEVYLDALADRGISTTVETLNKDGAARSRLYRSAANYDGVFIHKKRLNMWDARRIRRYARKIIYDYDDAVMVAETPSFRRTFSRRHLFNRMVRLSDQIIAGNDYLADQARPLNNHVTVLPTGLNVHEYDNTLEQKRGEDQAVRLVWIGSKSTVKYLGHIVNVLDEIHRRYPNVILRIISDAFITTQSIPVEQCLWSLERQASELASCDIGLAPLPDTPFTRGKCGFKILQYASAALPTVASAVGVQPAYVQGGTAGYVVDSEQAWLNALAKLIETPTLRHQMGRAARLMVETNFDLSVLSIRFCDLVENTLSNE